MKRYTIRLPHSTPKTRLDDYLVSWLPGASGTDLSKAKIRTLILSGAVYVNRHRNKIPSNELFAGAVIEVYFDESRMKVSEGKSTSTPAILTDSKVLFEDEWIILVNKDPGIPTQPTIDPNRPNLFDLTKKYLSKKRSGSEPYLGLHHRLDRDTSGVVLFTKSESANKGVAELFAQHRIQKTYQCLVWRSPSSALLDIKDQFTVKNFLGRISAKSETARFGSVNSNGDPAHTDFRVMEVFRQCYWLEASPRTGRTHQIRIHTSESHLPILGDPLYFPKNVFAMVQAPRLMLHAQRLEFDHPVTGVSMKVEAPLPDDFLKVLSTLKA
jgi:23S rRNA pseudouridine1911/1915/1917 synthase